MSLWKDLHDVGIVWQALVIAIGFAMAWQASRYPLPRWVDSNAKWQEGVRSLQMVRLPLTALVLVLIGRWTLGHYQTVSLLDLAVPLLFALTVVRALAYIVRLIFRSSTTMAAALRVVSWLVWLGALVYITGYASDLLQFLEDTAFHVGKHRLSVLLLLQTGLSLTVALLLSLWLGHLIEGRVMAATVDINLRVMLTKLVRPVLALIVILIVLPMIGVDLTALSVFGGAIGVGIGFGLQKIASNYISGFIILLDRSVTIGDSVTIDKHSGQLTKMTARYVVMRDGDGAEIIIPNETVITSIVVNHSYTDKTVRVPVGLHISYDSDLDIAMGVLVETAQAHPRALKHPPPNVLIKSFGDNGIELELGVWMNDANEGRASLRSDLFRTIWREFQLRGIEIPYPQREVRLVKHDFNLAPAAAARSP